MPKLRKLKNYEEINHNGEKPNDEKNFRREFEESGSTRYSNENDNKGWLSSANIISTISDKRIKTAINHYQTLIALLEEELSLRKMGIKPSLAEDVDTFKRFTVQADAFNERQDFSFELESDSSTEDFRFKKSRIRTSTRSEREFRRKRMAIKKFLKKQASLTKEQRSFLFEEWLKLI